MLWNQKEINPLPPQWVAERKRDKSCDYAFLFHQLFSFQAYFFVLLLPAIIIIPASNTMKVKGQMITHVSSTCTSTYTIKGPSDWVGWAIYTPPSVWTLPFCKKLCFVLTLPSSSQVEKYKVSILRPAGSIFLSCHAKHTCEHLIVQQK